MYSAGCAFQQVLGAHEDVVGEETVRERWHPLSFQVCEFFMRCFQAFMAEKTDEMRG